jgi:hypothetical protein
MTDAALEIVTEEAVEEKQPQSFGSMIDEMYELREEMQGYTSKAKKLKEQMDILEAAIINRLDVDETTMSRGKAASAILTETVVPKIDDWDEFYSYIQENEAFHLLQRRPSTAACRETLEAGEQIAGVSTFTKRAISLRKIT